MAQRVEAVENPRYNVSGLSTTSGSIVSTRAVMVPPTIQGTFKGSGDYSNGGNQYIQFQIADNECYLDNKCMYMICDLLIYGPGNSELVGTGTKYGAPIDLYFDQSSDALFSQLTIGSPQGLKFEEIQQYNMWANIIRLHTESSTHKEHDLLRYTEYSKSKGKEYGLQHLTDDQWQSPVRLAVGIKNRVAIRFDFSDFLQNIELFPLFLMRNGLQITIYLENAYKAFYCPSGFSNARDIVLGACAKDPNHLFGKGGAKLADGTNSALSPTPDVNTTTDVDEYFSPYYALGSNFSGAPKLIKSTASVWLKYGQVRSILQQCGECSAGADRNQFFAIPVTVKEFNQIVWSGFALAPISFRDFVTLGKIQDGGKNADDAKSAHCYSSLTSTTAAVTASAFEGLVSAARKKVPQLDVDGSIPHVNLVAGSLATVKFTRFTQAADHDISVAQMRDFIGNWHLFSYNDVEQVPFADLTTNADVVACNNQHIYSGGQLIFHCADAVRIDTAGAAAGTTATSILTTYTDVADVKSCIFTVADPGRNALASVLYQWGLPQDQRKFRYEITNPQLMLNLIKPSAEIAMRAQQDFTSPSGIAVKYKKTIYRKLSFTETNSGLLQVTLPISVRSLTGLIFVIQDPALDAVPNNVINNMLLANLSTFQNRRVTEQNIQVGGQQYPVYTYQMRPDGDTAQYWEAHVLELEKLFGVAGSSSFNACLSRPMIKKTRNMLAGGYLGANNPIKVGNLSATQRCTYTDASGVVYGMNLSKDWVRSFTCGIDSSAVGNISLNLQFKDPSNASNVSTAFGASSGGTNQSGARAFSIHMFALCDAVVTLQESANLVRS